MQVSIHCIPMTHVTPFTAYTARLMLVRMIEVTLLRASLFIWASGFSPMRGGELVIRELQQKSVS